MNTQPKGRMQMESIGESTRRGMMADDERNNTNRASSLFEINQSNVN